MGNDEEEDLGRKGESGERTMVEERETEKMRWKRGQGRCKNGVETQRKPQRKCKRREGKESGKKKSMMTVNKRRKDGTWIRKEDMKQR
jgi:hypothetical protein